MQIRRQQTEEKRFENDVKAINRITKRRATARTIANNLKRPFKVVFTGFGNVSEATAQSVVDVLNQQKKTGRKVEVIVQVRREDKAQAIANDIEDNALSKLNPETEVKYEIFHKNPTKWLELLRNTDVVIHTAGEPRKPGMDRPALLEKNLESTLTIAYALKHAHNQGAFNGHVLVVSNPLNHNTTLIQKESGLPTEKIIGISSGMDAKRAENEISEYLINTLKIPQATPDRIHVNVLGEHGDLQVLHHEITLGGIPIGKYRFLGKKITLPEELRKTLELKASKRAAKIIDGKSEKDMEGNAYQIGGTTQGPAGAIRQVFQAIALNKKRIIPIGLVLPKYSGANTNNICLGVLAEIGGKNGAKPIPLKLNPAEKDKLEQASQRITHELDIVQPKIKELKTKILSR